jgi:hypothetical protein
MGEPPRGVNVEIDGMEPASASESLTASCACEGDDRTPCECDREKRRDLGERQEENHGDTEFHGGARRRQEPRMNTDETRMKAEEK